MFFDNLILLRVPEIAGGNARGWASFLVWRNLRAFGGAHGVTRPTFDGFVG